MSEVEYIVDNETTNQQLQRVLWIEVYVAIINKTQNNTKAKVKADLAVKDFQEVSLQLEKLDKIEKK